MMNISRALIRLTKVAPMVGMLAVCVPGIASARAETHYLSTSKGVAAVNRYAAEAGSQVGAEDVMLNGCKRLNRSSVECQIDYYITEDGPPNCVSEAKAHYVGSRLMVSPIGGIDCSSGGDVAEPSTRTR